MKNELIFDIKNASYTYLDKYPALKNVNVQIKRSERIALLGANGSGKSTLLLLLAGLIFSKTGSVKFLDNILTEEKVSDEKFRSLFRSSVGIVFQNPDIQLFNSNVKDEILFGLLQLSLPEDEIGKRLENSLSIMAIGHLTDRHPQYLSTGEKKRVSIASVLAMEPDIILLDEPTAGLDPRTMRHFMDIVNVLSAEGTTIVTATQDIHIVPEIADRAIVLSEDKSIVKDDIVSEVLKDRELLERHNLIHSHIHMHQGRPHVHPHEHPDHHYSHAGQ